MPKDKVGWRLTPLNITVIYSIIGVIWGAIFRLVPAEYYQETQYFKWVETVNHGMFILATAGLLYYLIQRSEDEIIRGKEILHRLNHALKTFSGCNQAIIRADEEQQLMNDVCRTIVEIGGYRLAWVGIAQHDERKTVRPVAHWGDITRYLDNLDVCWSDTDKGRGPSGTAIRTGVEVVVQDIRHDSSWAPWREKAISHGFAASISLPLKNQDNTFGALVIFSEEQGSFDIEEVKLLKQMADDLSYGITALRMNVESREVEKERKLLAAVIEQAMEGIILFDSEGIIKYVNPSVKTITGRYPSEMLGRNILTLESEELTREFYKSIWESFSRGEVRTGRFNYKGKDGAFYEIDATLWSISDSSGVVNNHVVLIRDLSNEVKLERQLRQAQRMEAIATLAGGIAHDFNNNLASIITCTEMARDDAPEGSPLRELLDVVLNSGYRGRNLVKQILTFCCLGEQERQPVHIEPIVEECLKLMRASFPVSIRIQQNITENLGVVLADPTQIHQIILNLCTNAAHAMQKNGGVMEISLTDVYLDNASVSGIPNIMPGSYIKLTVKDNGHGMDSDTMERIFDPFFTTKGHTEGTGLGLSVVHGIVKNHGGAITVKSIPGEGAEFDVFLPRIEHIRGSAASKSSESIPMGNECILFVDDEEDVVFSVQKMLERLGYKVVACKDGSEALKIFRDRPYYFDLIITDQNMTIMTGNELTKELLLIRPDIPVILYTGLGSDAVGTLQIEEIESVGIREVAYKPLDRDEMAAIIRRVLNRGAEQ